eukprot:TRINITY_DN11365_c0_g1_i1.p1 TRINITY_DN11365_c0_g1~~TRINITY_DN11365_c0_g1_i1.p1  ORF type:complete len:164 (-),score=26.52 TRINITY_DN11365_c0_g1_i1:105-527(-)
MFSRVFSSARSSFATPSQVSWGRSFATQPHRIELTEAAKDRLKFLNVETQGVYLRILVKSGGCNGYLTSFQLDQKEKLLKGEYKAVNEDGATVVLDAFTAELLDGAVIDYESDIARSAFKIKELPKATSECGCKVSFGTD